MPFRQRCIEMPPHTVGHVWEGSHHCLGTLDVMSSLKPSSLMPLREVFNISVVSNLVIYKGMISTLCDCQED